MHSTSTPSACLTSANSVVNRTSTISSAVSAQYVADADACMRVEPLMIEVELTYSAADEHGSKVRQLWLNRAPCWLLRARPGGRLRAPRWTARFDL